MEARSFDARASSSVDAVLRRCGIAAQWAFGVLAPLAGFAWASREGLFGLWTVPFVVYALVTCSTMATWLSLSGRHPVLHAIAAGMLWVGAAVAIPFAMWIGNMGAFGIAWGIHVGYLPYVLFGAMGMIPVLGLVTYVVACCNAFRLARPEDRRRRIPWLCAGLSAAMLATVALAVHHVARRTVRDVLETQVPLDQLALDRWAVLAPGADWDEIADAWADADAARADRIEDALVRLNGRPIRGDRGVEPR